MKNGRLVPDFVQMRRSVLALLYCYARQGCRLLEACHSATGVGDSPEWWNGKNCYRERYAGNVDAVIEKLSVFRSDGFVCSAPFPWKTRRGMGERLRAWFDRSFRKPQDKIAVPRRFPAYMGFLFRQLSANYSGNRELPEVDQLMLRLWEAADFIDGKLQLTELTNVSMLEEYGRFWKASTSRRPEDDPVITVNEFLLEQYGEFEAQVLESKWVGRK